MKGKGLIVHEYSGHTLIAVVGVVLSLINVIKLLYLPKVLIYTTKLVKVGF